MGHPVYKRATHICDCFNLGFAPDLYILKNLNDHIKQLEQSFCQFMLHLR